MTDAATLISEVESIVAETRLVEKILAIVVWPHECGAKRLVVTTESRTAFTDLNPQQAKFLADQLGVCRSRNLEPSRN